MGKVEEYRRQLQRLESWDDFLRAESRLPGHRANLELAYAVAWEGTQEQLLKFASLDADEAPENTPDCFLAVCGILGLGVLAARGAGEHFDILRKSAGDRRWRVREATALGLQIFGQKEVERLLDLMEDWANGTQLEQRAVVATLCEPELLISPQVALQVFQLLDKITESQLQEENRRSDEFRILRKSLAYGWSVAVAAQPDPGKLRMARWVGSQDKDIRWIMRQNLKKNRLTKMDAGWVMSQVSRLEG